MSTLDDLVLQDHLVRTLEATIDWKFIYPLVKSLYSDFGRCSIDPVGLFKMIFINYTFGINSMRMTGEEIKVNMAYRWTKPKEEWIKDINPIIVDKTNYYLNVFKALKVFEGHMQAHCLIPSKWWFYYKMWGTYTIEKYVEYHMHRNKVDMGKCIQKFKELGIAFYTKKRLKKMDDSLSR